MRSEFDTAEEVRWNSFVMGICSQNGCQTLNVLIAHTRTHGMFDKFASRITLHHAHLAHALGQMERARQCYRVAAHLTPEGSFVHVAAHAGDVACMIGKRTSVRRANCDAMDVDEGDGAEPGLSEGEREEVRSVADSCRGMGGALEGVGELLEACASSEIVRAKYTFSHLSS